MQGSFFEPGGTLAKLLNIIWILFIVYFTYRYISLRNNDNLGKCIFVFWVYLTINWVISPKVVISPEHGPFGTFGEYKNMTFALLTYFPFKYFLMTGEYKGRDLLFFSYFAFISGIICFIVKQIAAINAQFWLDNVTNNAGYMLVTVLPLMGIPLLFEKKFSFYLAILISTILVAFSVKRGAIICLLIIIVCFWYCVFYKANPIGGEKKFKQIISALLMLIILVFGLSYVITSNDYLLLRIEDMFEGNSSGRDEIAYTLLGSFQNSSIIEKLLGQGMSQTLAVAGLYAHNDWLELLIDQGIIGVLLYAILFKNMVSIYLRYKNKSSPACNFLILSTVCSWFARSVFSMGFSVPESCLYLIAISSAIYFNNNQNKYAKS